ncbi:N-acetyllactosaminide 3-alpha-galactosyltransferase [Ancylostoma caninum]|uniref:Hexosyltransferase n=1 Tax=Ancylostoma caninum TaxID=29170 RepID=A0A368FUK7_ANCCA|nr:N-acetyllactosaminide 3-alpha-galactosyltransferase [Ancylostoma caninum]
MAVFRPTTRHCFVRTHSRYWQLKRAILAVASITCFGITAMNFKSNYLRNDRSVEVANERARRMFGNVSFLDPRLQLRSYTIVPNPGKCANVNFAIVVHISVNDESGRNRWRATYGNPLLMQQTKIVPVCNERVGFEKGLSTGIKFSYTLIFSVGLPSSPEHQEMLGNESRMHGDILQANYMDTYRNLTLKQLAELRYVASSCQDIKAIIKLDDDVGWNVEKASQFINKSLSTNEICCSRRSYFKPLYKPGEKWTVTKEEWSLPTFPPHCVGMMYIASIAAIKRMLAVVYLQKFFWIDDVFITGVLTKASNITVRHLDAVNEEYKFPLDVNDGASFFSVYKKYFVYWFMVYNQKTI